jgi:hypothetical protein
MPDALAKVGLPGASAGQKPFALLLLAVAVGALVGTAALNYSVDPRAEFPPDRYIALRADFYESHLRSLESSPPAGLAIVGSSSALQLHAEDFGRPDVVSYAAPQSSLQDAADFLAYADAVGKRPAELLVVVDDFTALDVDYNRAILPASQAYWQMTGRQQPAGDVARQLVASLDGRYLLDTARVLGYSHVTGYPDVLPWQQRFADPPEEIPTPRDGFMASYRDEARLAPAKLAALDQLAGFAARGTNVTFLYPPIAPGALDELRGDALFERVAEALDERLLAHCGPRVRVVDFRDVAAFGGEPLGFYDSRHFDEANGARIALALPTAPDRCVSA